MRTRWLTLALLSCMSCSDGGMGANVLPAEKAPVDTAAGIPHDRTAPSAAAIIAATDCEPPPCDDVGACARMLIAEVRDMQCVVSPSGETARCSFEMVPDLESTEERRRLTDRVTFNLRRQGDARWCIGT